MCHSETNLSLEGLSIVQPSKLQILAGENYKITQNLLPISETYS